ncbi:uncharacterized protein LOC122085882 [Macadamia integrifolia]|uniref:uncharacterized protein LOC122085882 n=1 Tax=Macadamia integrifolia TaxID=60698 RepID=UPI001C4F825D|nr:uncharacterized protein LOC122085882 [Macadamia integrifolia]XP_042510418.1 uncharacterized protein LOC122085882 [Macadamia integrifolia]XP_042510419.1 uncharacterized protein LOC122085882 [Macadamia integrifolia]
MHILLPSPRFYVSNLFLVFGGEKPREKKIFKTGTGYRSSWKNKNPMDMKTGDTQQQKRPSCNNRSSRQAQTQESNFLPMMSLCFLTVNGVVTFVRAHAHGDTSTMAFVLFLYFGFLSLFCCLKAFDHFPPHEESPKKELLKVAIWVISTSLNVGLAVRFAPLIHPIGAIFICALASVSSGFGFYFFFIHRVDPSDVHNGSCKSYADNKKKKFFVVSSLPLKVAQKDTKPSESTSPLENV